MASNKEGKLNVSIDPSGIGFSVKGQPMDRTFKLLSEFHSAADQAALTARQRQAVETAVVRHFNDLNTAQPIDSAHLPPIFDKVQEAVAVDQDRENSAYVVKLPFHPDVVKSMRAIPGARFLEPNKAWSIPLEARGALLPALEAAGQTLQDDAAARQALLASVTAIKFPSDTEVKVTDFHRKNWIYSGEIVAANLFYAAQRTHQSEGEAIIVVHQQSSLDRQVFVGDHMGIKYNDKGRGAVFTREQMQAEFASISYDRLHSTLDTKVDGVTVSQLEDGGMLVSIDHHSSRPAMPLHRMDKFLEGDEKVKFEQNLAGFVIPAAALSTPVAQEVLAGAVADARREIREDVAARRELLTVAQEKLAGAKVSFPIPKPTEWQEGTILFVNDRYALQASGRDFMKAHDLRNLGQVPAEGQMVRISYQAKGKALVEPSQLGLSQSHKQAARRTV